MKRFTLIMALVLLLAALPVAALGDGAEQMSSGYYGIMQQTGVLGQVALGTSEQTLLSRIYPGDGLTLTGGVKTGAVLSAPNMPSLTLAVQADCSGDGNFSATDLLLVRSHILDLQSFTPAQAVAADVTGDGDVTVSDFLQMKSRILGLSEFSLHSSGDREAGILLAVGQSAEFAGEDVTVSGTAVSWADGQITALSEGTARVSSGGQSLLVTVCTQGLQVSLPEAVTLKKNSTYQLQPRLNHPVETAIAYQVSDSSVISVSESGMVTALSTGQATVTARLPDGYTATQEITVRNPYTVCIDAGHQQAGISAKEPNGPGSSVMKAKLTSGTQGVVTGIEEYELNLDIALRLKAELIERGYDVVMIRETNDCPVSNAERAKIANESGADIFIRIHANGSENSSVNGAETMAPSLKNPYLTKEIIVESQRLSQVMIDAYCQRTGAKNKGIYTTDTMTGINWCQIPVTIVEMGYMSNPEEDRLMATDAYREKMTLGIADGVDAYFAEE